MEMKQQTLKSSFTLQGKGLHTGLDIEITFLPAPENHGYKIQRVDLDGQPVLDAVAENVINTQRGTVLGKNDITVSTIEHAMAALYASEIDNCLIQVNAPEFPILDGSAQIYVENIMRVGIEEQSAEKDYYIIRNKVEIEQSEFDRIADLVGVSHKNADELGFINNRPLVFNNEPARHKLLDILGDIALIGKPIKGRIIATRPGHKINNLFARAIRKEVKRQEIQVPFYDPNKEPVMDVNRIKGLLPHRYPMLLVDKIIEIGKNHIVGIKNFTSNEPFFQGHFPQEPVVPGVLLIEAMAQTGGLLTLNTVEDPSSYSTYFMKIDNVKFRQKVVPGDTAIFHVSFMTEMRRGCAYMKGYVFVGDKITTEAEFMAQITKNK